MENQHNALKALDDAWNGTVDLLELIETAEHCITAGRPAVAVALYRAWLRRPRDARDHFVWFNLGVILSSQNEHSTARDAFLHAIHRAPNFFQAHINLGLTYERLGEVEAALARWRHVMNSAEPNRSQDRPLLIQALNHFGRVAESLKRYGEASSALERSLELDPDQPDVIHHLIFQRAKQCAWPIYRPLTSIDTEQLRSR